MAQDRRDYPATIRQRMTERWAQRRLGKIDHERRVMLMANRPQRRQIGPVSLHAEIALRHYPAVTRFRRPKRRSNRVERVVKMVLADDWLPLNASERRSVAYLTRYHRGAVPEVGFDEILNASENRKRLRTVLAILRAADALDGRQLQAPRLVFAMLGKKLSVTVYLEEDTPKARRFFKRRKKFRLFEEVIGLKVDIEIRHADTVHTVS